MCELASSFKYFEGGTCVWLEKNGENRCKPSILEITLLSLCDMIRYGYKKSIVIKNNLIEEKKKTRYQNKIIFILKFLNLFFIAFQIV